jgi:spore germination cell wall hydrolase CwlJ-like protein
MKRLIPVFGSISKTARKDAAAFARELAVDVLARTIWGEARGEGSAGMQAVASVVLNRLKVAQDKGGKYWWGAGIIEICQKPYQFSAWNKDDPNLPKVMAVDASDIHFATALRIARRALEGLLDDPVKGATHYHTAGVRPAWSRAEKPVAVIGRHIFYRPSEV